MAMCQMEESSSDVSFTYVISADGLFKETIFKIFKFFYLFLKILWPSWKENRHYVSPQSSGPLYYPFLRSAGSALLNGEMFFFGGYNIPKKVFIWIRKIYS